MVSDEDTYGSMGSYINVLILVLMEYGLWHALLNRLRKVEVVLILVLMEYGLWPNPVLVGGIY